MIEIKSINSGVDLEKLFMQMGKQMPELIAELTEVARADNEENVRTERSYDGSALKPLSADYKKWKSAKLGYTDIFKGKQLKLINAIKKKVTANRGIVYIDKVRDDVMTYLEEGGRRGFGLGERLQKKLVDTGTKWIKKFG
jgi:hypothetical protein